MKNEFGRHFINIWLETSAVAAASVVEGPPRCSNKGGQKRRCLYNACENHLFTAARARAGIGPSPAFIAPEPHRASSVWGLYIYIYIISYTYIYIYIYLYYYLFLSLSLSLSRSHFLSLSLSLSFSLYLSLYIYILHIIHR